MVLEIAIFKKINSKVMAGIAEYIYSCVRAAMDPNFRNTMPVFHACTAGYRVTAFRGRGTMKNFPNVNKC